MLVVVGRIGRPHGIRGEVTVEVLTDDPADRFAPGSILQTDPAERGPLTVAATRFSGRTSLVLFDGVADRNQAEALRGTLLQVDTDQLPELSGDDYYDHQLIGLRALSVGGDTLGEVTDVIHAPAAPILQISRVGGGQELVPFVAAIVPTVDLGSGTLIVDPPDGMFA